MSHDFIDDLLDAVRRVIEPDCKTLKEILIVCGMPEKTANLRYLSFNRQIVKDGNRTLQFSAVAIINNKRISSWRLIGYRKKLSKWIFNDRWTRNPLDLFMNRLRCSREMMDLLESTVSDYCLMGIFKEEGFEGNGFIKRKYRHTRPILAVPKLVSVDIEKVEAFEKKNEIRKSRLSVFGL